MERKRRKSPDPERRREEILRAAAAVFTEKGFAAARIEDIARRAGVAKGTVYLYFPDKEALFTALIGSLVAPVAAEVARLSGNPAIPARRAVATIYGLLEEKLLQEERRQVLRLLIAEGGNFPAITEYYYREVVTVGLRVLRPLLRSAAVRGELRSPLIAETPQAIMAAPLLAVIWGSLFERHEALDTRRLFEAFLDTLFLPEREETP